VTPARRALTLAFEDTTKGMKGMKGMHPSVRTRDERRWPGGLNRRG
jgi:hypothetical protein